MSAAEIQNIFRERHILVLDVEPNDEWSFGEEALSRLGPLEQERQMQGMTATCFLTVKLYSKCIPIAAHRRTDDNSESMLMKGTFKDVIIASRENHSVVFNVLDIPMGDSLVVDVPPAFSNMASEEYAKVHCPPLPISQKDFRNDLIWTTVANKYAVSWGHVDDEGFATGTCTQTGGKMWALATPIEGTVEDIEAFKEKNSWDFNTDKFRYEILYLPPRCVL